MDHTITCRNCGKSDNSLPYGKMPEIIDTMESEGLCFECAYYWNLVTKKSLDVREINGMAYSVKAESTIKGRKPWLRCSRFIASEKTGAIEAFANCAPVAPVPPNFSGMAGDVFRFITKATYLKLRKHAGFRCMKKGCFNRYRCYWYDRKQAEPDGPWNKVPRDHKPEDENCEIFINKKAIYVNT